MCTAMNRAQLSTFVLAKVNTNMNRKHSSEHDRQQRHTVQTGASAAAVAIPMTVVHEMTRYVAATSPRPLWAITSDVRIKVFLQVVMRLITFSCMYSVLERLRTMRACVDVILVRVPLVLT